MPHILVLPSWLESKWGGGGTFMIEQAAIMQEIANCKIGLLVLCAHHICKVKKSGLPFVKGVEVETREGVEVWLGYYPYYLPRRPIAAKKHFGEKLFLQYMDKHGKPDFLWVQSISHAGYWGRYLAKKYDIPYFVHEHATKYMTKNLRPSVCRRDSEVINDSVYCAAVSDELRRDMLRQIPADNIRVIHNPVNMIFAEVPPALRRQNPFVFISTAPLRSIKKVDLIIRAFAKVHAESPNSRLLIVGDGDTKTALENLAEELHLSDAVVFTGMQSRVQTCKHLQAADAFVAASLHESFGLALAEALMCGLPSITPDVGIAGEMVNDKNGVLLDSRDMESIVAAMLQVMRGDYDSAAIQQTARQQVAPEIFARRVRENLLLL